MQNVYPRRLGRASIGDLGFCRQMYDWRLCELGTLLLTPPACLRLDAALLRHKLQPLIAHQGGDLPKTPGGTAIANMVENALKSPEIPKTSISEVEIRWHGVTSGGRRAGYGRVRSPPCCTIWLFANYILPSRTAPTLCTPTRTKTGIQKQIHTFPQTRVPEV